MSGELPSKKRSAALANVYAQPPGAKPPPAKRPRQVAPTVESEDDGDVSSTPVSESGPTASEPATSASQATSTTTDTSSTAVDTTNARTTDDIRLFFELGRKDPPVPRVCNECQKKVDSGTKVNVVYSYKAGTSTTVLRQHIVREHPNVCIDRCMKAGVKVPQGLQEQARKKYPSLDRWLQEGVDNNTKTEREKFSLTAFLRLLISFIVADDQSINLLECPEFRALLLLLCEHLEDSDIPHRTKMTECILKSFAREFAKLKAAMKASAASVGKISFTSDLWTTQTLAPFMALTAHWIERLRSGKLVMRADLLAFRHLPSRHTGENIAIACKDVLTASDLLKMIGWFTLDNASNNDTFMEELETGLGSVGVSFNARQQRIRCFPHVIHLAVRAMVDSVTSPVFAATDAEDFNPTLPLAVVEGVEFNFEDAMKRDPISMLRTLFRKACLPHIRASTFRRARFAEMVEFELKLKQRDPPQKAKMLLLDSPTRWSSMFGMLVRAIEYQRPLDVFCSHPDNKELACYLLTADEWKALKLLHELLKLPHNVQQIVSSESTPSMAQAAPALEILMDRLEKFANKNPATRGVVDCGLNKLWEYYGKMTRTDAYVHNQILNPAFKTNYIERHFEPSEIEAAKKAFTEEVTKYRNTPPTPAAALSTSALETSATTHTSAWLQLGEEDLDDDDEDVVEVDQTVEDEIRAYLSAPRVAQGSDPLVYWQDNCRRFPTIFRMAMDYLPIQASAVPSERVFSSSARTDTKERNRLGPELMEALQMLKFMLKKRRLDFRDCTEVEAEAAAEEGGEVQDEDLLSLVIAAFENGNGKIDEFLRERLE